MAAKYFEPFIGTTSSKTKLLVMSESAYDWKVGGKIVSPGRNHPRGSLDYWTTHFGEQPYFTAMGRALTGMELPAEEELRKAWDDCAYTIFVQGSVGLGAKKRPTIKQFRDAGSHFLKLIEKLRPEKVLVTGITMWKLMPEADVYLLDNLQAYRLPGGELVWCLAIPHPSNRQKDVGFKWDKVAERIRLFRMTKFPETA